MKKALVVTERVIDTRVIASSIIAIIAILSLSAYFGFLLSGTDLSLIGSPFSSENSLESAAVNSLVFLALVLIGTLLILLLIRSRKTPLLPFLMASAVLFSFWGILEVFLELVVPVPPSMYPVCELLVIGVSVLTAILIIKPFSILLLDLLMVVYGSMAGALFYAILPPWSVVSVATVLALYDLYSVFRGPLRRILESTLGEGGGQQKIPSNLRGGVIYIGGLALGMGDVLIYSMLSPLYLLYPSPSPLRWALGILALIIGFLLTLNMLKKRKFMPALPLPVLLSLIAYLAALNAF